MNTYYIRDIIRRIMGRKRKEVENTVDNLIVIGPQEEYKKVEGKPLDSLALGIAKNDQGYYNLVEINFNLETKETELKVIGEQDTKDLIEERYRIHVANKLFEY
jgi:hypothetical protein